MQIKKGLIAFSVLFMGLFSSVSAFGAEALKIVENEKVCMVTDMHFPKAQIPVTVEKKTYYGCCENCKATLTNDAKVRTAIDPVSKKPVDKAKAVIAMRADHSVVYFENKTNFQKYAKTESAKPSAAPADHSGHAGH